MLHAHGKTEVAGRQGHDRAGQVSGEAGGLGHTGIGVDREQEVLHGLVSQRTGTGHAVGQQRVPGIAAGDRAGGGAATGHAIGIDERGAQGLLGGQQRHVATCRLGDLVAVPHRPDVPVEGAAGKVEVARQARRKAQGLELAFGGTRHFPQTTTELHVLAQDIEGAVGGQRGTKGLRLVRVTGDLLVGGALVVEHIGIEADGVGHVVVAVDIQRLTLDAGGHHHLLVGVGVVRGGVQTVVGTVGRITTFAQGVPEHIARVDVARLTSLCGRVQARITERAVLADRAEAGARVVRAGAAGAGVPAVTGKHRLLLGILGRQGDATALALGTQGERILGGVAVAFAVLADIDLGLGAVKALAGDHVDHAGDGIGTVDGRSAVLEDLDALDGRHRDLAQVLVAAGGGAQALAVHQHQGAVGTQVAQVDVVTTDVLARGQRIGTRDRRRAGSGEVLQHVGDRGEALLFQRFAGHGQDRLLGFHVSPADARTGDFQAIQGGGTGSGAVLRAGQRGYQCHGDTGRQQAQPDRRITQLHVSLQVVKGAQ